MKPTKAQIKKEIKELTEIKPRVRHFSMFRDDNHKCIEAQIEAVAAEITRYQQQLHSLQQATYELACKAVKAVDSSTECDKEAVAAEITRYQQQLHSLQQATYELACNELTHYKQSAFNN